MENSRQYIHWTYFIALERDLENLSRYIEFSEENYSTYSIELTHLLLTISSEVDVVLSSLCKIVNPDGKNEHISDYQKTIEEYLPQLLQEEVYFPRYGLIIEPFLDWKNEKNLEWWTSYNKVKHHRNTNFRKANLKNTLFALSSLGIIVLYYYKEIFSREIKRPLSFNDITSKFHQESLFTRFNKTYYYVPIRIMG